MFERFSDEGRDVIVAAQIQARGLGHSSIGTEHLLLALLDPGAGTTAAVLGTAGVDADRVRQEIQRLTRGARAPLTAEDAQALSAIGIDLPAVLARIEDTLGPGALTVATAPAPPRRRLLRRRRRVVAGALPFSARAKKVLELSVREAQALQHDHAGPAHLLLGLLREGRGLACRILTDDGVHLDELRRATLDALAAGP